MGNAFGARKADPVVGGVDDLDVSSKKKSVRASLKEQKCDTKTGPKVAEAVFSPTTGRVVVAEVAPSHTTGRVDASKSTEQHAKQKAIPVEHFVKPDGNDMKLGEPSPKSKESESKSKDNKTIIVSQEDFHSDKSDKTETVESFLHYNDKINITHFDLLRVIGKGSFGKVMLVKRNGVLYALKSLRKAALIKRNQLAHTSTERTVLQNIQCPFLVHLSYAFQTTEKLYMVLDFVGGGELYFWLRKEKIFSENRCRLYAAEMSLALQALHQENIVYRDLKPENILLDSRGHLKLTDFGLAKGGILSAGSEKGTRTFCGTPEYLAPEILENNGHGYAVDWWALGTLLYEMLLGLPPFFDLNVKKMYHKILYDPLRFPKSENRQISDNAKDVLRKFLERRIQFRLGSEGVNSNFKENEFFLPLDFDVVYAQNYDAEFIPPISTSETDVSNFDEEFTKEEAHDSLVVSNMTSTMVEKSAFVGFTYNNRPSLTGPLG